MHARINCMSDGVLNKTKRLPLANKPKLVAVANEREYEVMNASNVLFSIFSSENYTVMLHVEGHKHRVQTI